MEKILIICDTENIKLHQAVLSTAFSCRASPPPLPPKDKARRTGPVLLLVKKGNDYHLYFFNPTPQADCHVVPIENIGTPRNDTLFFYRNFDRVGQRLARASLFWSSKIKPVASPHYRMVYFHHEIPENLFDTIRYHP